MKVTSLAVHHVIVTFEKDIVQVYHGGQDVGFLLWRNVWGCKGDLVDIGIRKEFA